ncbi:hypothetical protein QBC40DRAFT_278978 [Triangularia verruculosa]|uniref:Uncharacterized protein n=1 Tax=Triangularia verruculosa TaxID=2587418 RepID=A0AAN6XNI8_9PEZI|nr:hypothetical protein QBC40DRAFT_278978 [Triangularia verruculosa]
MASSSIPAPQDPDQKTLTTKGSNQSLAAASTVVPDNETTGKKQLETPARYLYHEKVAEPNPDYVAKPPSKFSQFMSKFQSPAVKATKAKRQAEIDEEKRTGIKVYTPAGAPMGSGAHVANSIGNFGGGGGVGI